MDFTAFMQKNAYKLKHGISLHFWNDATKTNNEDVRNKRAQMEEITWAHPTGVEWITVFVFHSMQSMKAFEVSEYSE